MSRQIYVIAGPNGAGKTTFAKTFLPRFADCKEFVNADLIATGLSPFSPSEVGVRAGRLVLERIRELSERGESFGFETTLSGKTYLNLFKTFQKKGYLLEAIYLWLPSEDLAVQRVRDRVRLGGHNVPELDIRRRFTRGLRHFLLDYQPSWKKWTLFNNSLEIPETIAFGERARKNIVQTDLFQVILKQSRLL